MDPHDRPLAELIGHDLEIATRCRCSKITVFSPAYLVERMGTSVTLKIAAGRLICQTCRQRPTLLVAQTWGTSGGRDRRIDPAPLPEWVLPLLEG